MKHIWEYLKRRWENICRWWRRIGFPLLWTVMLLYNSTVVQAVSLEEKAKNLEEQAREEQEKENPADKKEYSLPDFGEVEEGELPEPSDPEKYTTDHLIFIGDSRTVDMKNAVGDNSTWECRVGMGYVWMTGTAVPEIESMIDDQTTVIILMGVNDVSNLTNYINYINAKANEWAALGANTCYVSVGPVTTDPYVTNEQIEVFNASMQASLVGVQYIDIYSYLMTNGYSTVDGIHYPDGVSIGIYNYILEHLEKSSGGIWG